MVIYNDSLPLLNGTYFLFPIPRPTIWQYTSPKKYNVFRDYYSEFRMNLNLIIFH